MAPKKRPTKGAKAKKSPTESPKRKGNLVVPKHGRGMIHQGACANPVAGTGRPPSEIRAHLRGSFDTRIAALERLADGAIKERDQLAAIDMLAKYGLGTTKEVSVEAVRDRVSRTLDVIRAHTTPKLAAAIIADLRPIWA